MTVTKTIISDVIVPDVFNPVSYTHLDVYKRQAVDKADQIGPTGMHLASDPKLRAKEKIIV